MSDDNYNGDLHAWIEPEIEARVVALILGEASDFEAEELERMMEERPEIRVFKRRLESVHGLLGTALVPQDEGDWELAPKRKAELLKAIDLADPTEEAPLVSAAENPGAKERRIRKAGRRVMWAAAACFSITLFLIAFFGRSRFAANMEIESGAKKEGRRESQATSELGRVDKIDDEERYANSTSPGAESFYSALPQATDAEAPLLRASKMSQASEGDLAVFADALTEIDAGASSRSKDSKSKTQRDGTRQSGENDNGREERQFALRDVEDSIELKRGYSNGEVPQKAPALKPEPSAEPAPVSAPAKPAKGPIATNDGDEGKLLKERAQNRGEKNSNLSRLAVKSDRERLTKELSSPELEELDAQELASRKNWSLETKSEQLFTQTEPGYRLRGVESVTRGDKQGGEARWAGKKAAPGGAGHEGSEPVLPGLAHDPDLDRTLKYLRPGPEQGRGQGQGEGGGLGGGGGLAEGKPVNPKFAKDIASLRPGESEEDFVTQNKFAPLGATGFIAPDDIDGDGESDAGGFGTTPSDSPAQPPAAVKPPAPTAAPVPAPKGEKKLAQSKFGRDENLDLSLIDGQLLGEASLKELEVDKKTTEAGRHTVDPNAQDGELGVPVDALRFARESGSLRRPAGPSKAEIAGSGDAGLNWTTALGDQKRGAISGEDASGDDPFATSGFASGGAGEQAAGDRLDREFIHPDDESPELPPGNDLADPSSGRSLGLGEDVEEGEVGKPFAKEGRKGETYGWSFEELEGTRKANLALPATAANYGLASQQESKRADGKPMLEMAKSDSLEGLQQNLASGEDRNVESSELESALRLRTEEKLRRIVLPAVQFDDVSLHEAVDFIQEQTKAHDHFSREENGKPLSYSIGGRGLEEGTKALVERDWRKLGDTRIKGLNLWNVPVEEALNSVAEQAKLRLWVDDSGEVQLLPLASAEFGDIEVHRWEIPQAAWQRIQSGQAKDDRKLSAHDLIAIDDSKGSGAAPKQALRRYGIEFPPGASVTYQSATGTFEVKNTAENLKLIDGLVEGSLKQLSREQEALKGFEKHAGATPKSTFSLNVSNVSFKLAKAALAKGEWPDAAKIRTEEFVNNFDYGDPAPNQDERVACKVEQAAHPFLQQRNLMRVSMRTSALGRGAGVPLRLTVLLDNSGSMDRKDRLESVKNAFRLLAGQLNEHDQVTVVSFARTSRLLADRVAGNELVKVAALVEATPSEGGTNLEQALRLGMAKAKEQKLEGGQNRVILLTDGAANLGNARPDELASMVKEMRQQGIAFDACGVGAEGYNDEILESLTRKGDGRYYFLDRPEDADAGFAKQIAGALRPAAQNVKVQVNFNPNRVGRYKLYGFEKHRLKKEDFHNDSVDAAEMAAEEAGNAIYQIEVLPEGEGDVGTVSVRFRDVATGLMIERKWSIPYQPRTPALEQSSASLRLASGAALLGERLKGSLVGEVVEMPRLGNLINTLPADYPADPRVKDLVEMANKVRELSAE